MPKKTKKFKLIDTKEEIPTYYTPKEGPPKKRIKLTQWQEGKLEEYFYMNVYPNKLEKVSIQEETGVPVRNVRIWFQNRRAKERGIMEEQMTRMSDENNFYK